MYSCDDKYLKRDVRIVGGLAVGYSNMMLMPVLNVALLADLSGAVNLLQLNNYNYFNSHINLNRIKINNLLPGRLSSDAVNLRKAQRIIKRKYGTLIFNKNNIAIFDKCATNKFIYPLCLYIKDTFEVPKVSLLPIMPNTNNKDTTTIDEFNKPNQYLNDSPNMNPTSFIVGVDNQEPITYKHPYTLFVPLITSKYNSTKYANRKYCLFFINLTFCI